MRRASALIATAGLLLAALTGCSSSADAASSCVAPISDGAASKLVSVNDNLGAVPKVDFPTPLMTGTTQGRVIVPGSGDRLVTGQQAKIELNVYNGTTGSPIQVSKYDSSSTNVLTLNDQTIKGITDGLACAQAGSRIAVVVSPDDAFGPQGGNSTLGIAATDSLVFVIDVVKTYLLRANGADQAPVNGLPAVVLDANGTPGITIPGGTPPADLQVAVLKKGTGDTVKEGDTVTVHYTGVLWADKKVFDSSWTKGAPAQLLAVDGSKTSGGVVPGFATAIIGQTVGSQILTVVPPAKGYGDAAQGTIPAGSTLVFVIDILGIG
ncbi:FKBP-type peptidyl-prolyl cis-trans isomerase [Cryobacterium sp. GrIS_2_6]|uniref:FKBP-type peptidyl-prolyl cis-trans isomerase n=1 Tax=Cryobacterium sp. GrIS_2_6 TaxID=3162785 RepID=UPI002E0C8B5B|nr:FKBP-type peptidyl-prolyl cis-trans isomerase [Cryobacterium psychrotolerans]MEC5149699.1 peptidylprolyl isomerase [Cryobacterium psychrotolerans]